MGRRRSGKHMLHDMDKKGRNIRSNIHDLNDNISKSQQKLEELKSEEARTYLRLAETRIELLDDPSLADQISHAEKEAQNLIASRHKSREALENNLHDNEQEQQQLEDQRIALSEQTEELYAKAKKAEQDIDKQLETDKAYQKFEASKQNTLSQITSVESKITLAREDYQKKSKPYHDDELFLYLKTRQYGTSNYKASSLVRTLDNWVANLVHYEQARRNYAILHALPGKLIAHKQLLEQKCDTIENDQKQYKQKQYKNGGALEHRNTYRESQQKLDEIDQNLDTLEQEHQSILEQMQKQGQSSDEFYNTAVETLNNIYKNKSIHNLRRYAAMTQTKADDKLIKRLADIEADITETQAQLSTYSRSLKQENKTLQTLQNVRKTYKQKRYDVRHTTFENGNTFNILLNEFLMGVLSNRRFWRAVGNIVVDVLDEIEIDFD